MTVWRVIGDADTATCCIAQISEGRGSDTLPVSAAVRAVMSDSDDDFLSRAPPTAQASNAAPAADHHNNSSRKRSRDEEKHDAALDSSITSTLSSLPPPPPPPSSDQADSDDEDAYTPARPPLARADESANGSDQPKQSKPAKKPKKEPPPLTRPILTQWEIERSAAASAATAGSATASKRTSALAQQQQQHLLHLGRLPSAAMYERSYMHRDHLTHLILTPTAFLLTASRDGVVKWWKKVRGGIEFIRQYRAHTSPLVSLTVDAAGDNAVSIGCDQHMRFYDVLNFDMVNAVELGFMPAASVWVHSGGRKPMVAVSRRDMPEVYFYHSDATQPINVIDAAAAAPAVQLSSFTAHSRPVYLLALNSVHNVVLSIDTSGVIDYFTTTNFSPPSPPTVTFTSKLDTDLYTFHRLGVSVNTVAFSHSGALFVTTSSDRLIRIFRFSTGRIVKQYDEGLAVVNERQVSDNPVHHLDGIDYGRRMAVEREYDKALKVQSVGEVDTTAQQLTALGPLPVSNVVWDDSDTYIIYSTLVGIKVLNVHTNTLVKVLGKIESAERFTTLALYQGTPVSAESAAARQGVSVLLGGGNAVSEVVEDPCLFALSYKRERFFWFSQREPAEEEAEEEQKTADGKRRGSSHTSSSRDVLNEKPMSSSTLTRPSTASSLASSTTSASTSLPSTAVIHTTQGDITISLYPSLTPRTYTNFTTHAIRHYYNHCLFHRVVPGFMIQTGDPTGTGSGGESVWGGQFEDEIVSQLRHDAEGVVSMANAGRGTNGSQFFITCAKAEWLDGKHTVFGRVKKGMDVVRAMEKVKCVDTRPVVPIKIINIEVLKE